MNIIDEESWKGQFIYFWKCNENSVIPVLAHKLIFFFNPLSTKTDRSSQLHFIICNVTKT